MSKKGTKWGSERGKEKKGSVLRAGIKISPKKMCTRFVGHRVLYVSIRVNLSYDVIQNFHICVIFVCLSSPGLKGCV